MIDRCPRAPRSIPLAALALFVGAVAAALAGAPAVSAGDGHAGGDFVFVQSSGGAADLQWVEAGDAEGYDLSGLADGERRTFGSGAGAVEVVREGDRIRIRRQDGPETTCIAGVDACHAIDLGDEVVIEIRKDGASEGAGSARVFFRSTAGPGASGVARVATAFGTGNGEVAFGSGSAVHVVRDCADEECATVTIDRIGGGPDGLAIGLRRSLWKAADDVDGCPDGFRTMRFTDETIDDGYLCVEERHPAGGSVY